MSQEYAWPPAPMRADPDGAAGPVDRAQRPLAELEPTLALAGLGQAFDFCAMGVLAVTVFPQVFFPTFPAAGGLAASLGVWALAYAAALGARPAVARLESRYGRPRLRVGIGRLLFAAGCLFVAALPAAWGSLAAAGLLVLARLAQGLALAAMTHQRLAPQVAAAVERRSRVRGWALAGGLGALGAGAVLAILFVALDPADFREWGWRYPFAMALAVNLVALFGDLQIEGRRESLRARTPTALRLVTVGGVPVGRGG